MPQAGINLLYRDRDYEMAVFGSSDQFNRYLTVPVPEAVCINPVTSQAIGSVANLYINFSLLHPFFRGDYLEPIQEFDSSPRTPRFEPSDNASSTKSDIPRAPFIAIPTLIISYTQTLCSSDHHLAGQV